MCYRRLQSALIVRQADWQDATARDVMASVADNWYEQPYKPMYTARVTYGQIKESEASRLYRQSTRLTITTDFSPLSKK